VDIEEEAKMRMLAVLMIGDGRKGGEEAKQSLKKRKEAAIR
jgi:hypothetical protein